MKITAITKFKHGALWQALRVLGWNQSELARKCAIAPRRIGLIINLQERPSADIANTIQRVLGEHGVFFDPLQEWPEAFTGKAKRIVFEQTKDINILELEAAHGYYNHILLPENASSHREEMALSAMSALNEREREVLNMRFGFSGSCKTLDECARKLNVSKARVSQIEAKAIRRVRNKYNRLEGQSHE